MLPRLAAEETLNAVTATAMGSGTMKESEARRAHADLARTASARRPPQADPRVLSLMGIAVEHVSRRSGKGAA